MSDLAAERTTQTIPAKAIPKPRLKWLAFAGLAGFLALGAARYGYDWWSVGRFIESTDDAYVGGNVTPISPHVAGFVAQILVADNDYVRAGQLLIRLDDRDFRAAADHANAIVAAATGNPRQPRGKRSVAAVGDPTGKSGSRRQDGRGDVRQAKTTCAIASWLNPARGAGKMRKRRLPRTRSLGPPSSRPRRPSTPPSSNSPYWTRKSPKPEPPSPRPRRIFRPQRLNLGYTEIRSPIDGYIGNRAAQVGAYVSGGAYLVTVIPAHELWVDANFKEDQLDR